MSKDTKQENIFENQPALLIILAAFLVGVLIIYASNSNNAPSQNSVADTPVTENQATQEQSENTFYTTDTVNIRNCDSLSCEVVGQYPINTDLILPYQTLSEMPKWVQISWIDNGETIFGFISKSVLSESKTKIVERVVQQQTASLSSIIKSWRPRVAYIECVFTYSDTGQVYNLSSGSGLALKLKDNNGATVTAIATNKHVVSDENGYGPSKCVAKLPDSNSVYEVANNNVKIGIGGLDWAYLNITYPDQHIKDIINQDIYWCQQRADIGESLVVLGYPSYGNDYLEITATEGIISGYDEEYYTTSAKIEQGNSGGVAISQKDNCYLGIPTGVRLGVFESLGRILDVRYFFQ
jgi:hypothetical protein